MWKKSYIYFFLLFIICFFCLPGCSGPKDEQPNILLISIDTLRQDHVSCYGYHRATTPTLDKLAREGIRFETCVSHSPWTLPAHMSVMTGLPPSLHQVQENDESLPENLNTLAQLLKKKQYKTCGIATSSFLSETFGFNRGFDNYQVIPYEKAGVITKKALKWLSKINIKNDKFFLFLHFFDVHWPYHPPKEFISMFGASPKDVKYGKFQFLKQFSYPENRLDPELKKKIIALYDGEIRYTDSQINRIIQFLKTKKVLDNTIIVVFSDHGEEFKEHGSFGHGHSLYKELIDVPLIVRYPPKIKANTVTSQRVVLSDIPLTLLKSANIPPPQQFRLRAEDLLGYMNNNTKRKHRDRNIILESTRRGPKRISIIKGNFKYIPSYVYHPYSMGKNDRLKWYRVPEGLYNCEQDPYEKINLSQNNQREFSILKLEVKKYIHRNYPALQLSFVPSPHQVDNYTGVVSFDSNLKDEPFGLSIDDMDVISPIEKTRSIKFALEVDDRRKSLLFKLSAIIKEVSLKIYRNQNLLYENTINLPAFGKELLLGSNNLENGGCLLKRNGFALKKPGKKAKLSKEEIEKLESLGYM